MESKEKKIQNKILQIKAKYFNLINKAMNGERNFHSWENPMEERHYEVHNLLKECESEINTYKLKMRKKDDKEV